MKIRYIYFFILFVLVFFGVTTQTHAQFSALAPNSINVDISPENPKPSSIVTVTLSSYDTDLNSSNITWKINGLTKVSSRGLKTYSFALGDSGTVTNLDVIIETSGGDVVEKSYTLKPSSVDLLWEAQGYTPQFYRGKTLFSHQDIIKFIALPHITGSNGQEIPASNLIYTWKKNGTILGDYSGYGMNTYTMLGSIISRSLNLSVTVSSPDSESVGSATVTVTPIEPSIVFYEKNPLYGIQFQKAFTDTVKLTNTKEISLFAVPYFFGVSDANNPNLSYKWSINRVTIDNTNTTTQTFRQVDGTNGSSYISLSIDNADKILQSASNGFNMQFGTN
ncbi:MAG: hypothetical protein WCK48_02120 [bacterium]